MWKNQLASLVSHQRNLVKILEKQMQLIETYVNLTAKTSSQLVHHQNCVVVEEQPDHFSTQISPKPGKERGTYPHSGQFRQNPPRIIADKRTTLCTNGQYKVGSSSQHSSPQPGNTSQHICFRIAGKNVLIESQCNKNSTSLLKLIKSGVMPRGGALRMWIRVGQCSCFH